MLVKWKHDGKVSDVTNEYGRQLCAAGLVWDVTHLPNPETAQVRDALGITEGAPEPDPEEPPKKRKGRKKKAE